MEHTIYHYGRRYAGWLARPAMVFYCLPLLMIILVCGTIAQRYIGLYDAQKMFFSSFILWIGIIPFPAGYSIITVISLCLLIKFLLFSTWRWKKAGIHLTHLGVLILLWGGLITAWHAEEGFLVIPEHEKTATISDYHQRTLAIFKSGQMIEQIFYQDLKPGTIFSSDILPFSLQIQEACRHCRIYKREDAPHSDNIWREMAEFMALEAQKPEQNDEDNLSGVTFQIIRTDTDKNGYYIAFEAMPKPITIVIDDIRYDIIYGKQQRFLPFTVTLTDFKKQFHPGTQTPSHYHSDIIIDDQGLKWPVRIEMNKPFRYKGYTLFQSSFVEDNQKTATILSVVKNKGWIFPYIGVGIITIGLLLHVLMTGIKKRRP